MGVFFIRGGLFEKVPLELPSKLFKPIGLWLNSFEGLLSMREAPAEVGPMSHFAPARGCGLTALREANVRSCVAIC